MWLQVRLKLTWSFRQNRYDLILMRSSLGRASRPVSYLLVIVDSCDLQIEKKEGQAAASWCRSNCSLIAAEEALVDTSAGSWVRG